MTIVTMPNDYKRESGAERIARFMAQAEAEYDKTICRMCGAKLDERCHCQHGCNDNAVTLAIIEAYSKPAPVIKQRCQTCGNHIDVCECEIVPMNAEHIRNGEA